ncbi:TonB-dependent receptor [Dokdonella soli]|uniref:TonB-dependent receptor n=1 Tax=Dokdonella soli TaxID=529810 RepID=A0ABP3TKJ5_9GAMM
MIIRKRPLVACLRYALLQGAAASSLCCGSALATDAAESAAQAGTGVDQAADPTDTASAQQLGNITVTAQSRTQEVQDVPIPMQIVTAKQVESLAATDLSKMNGYIPGLVVSGEQPTQPGYTLRGISISDFGIGTDSPIGIYEDDVYTGKTGGALLMFNDMQRIEVLKGPQGTLFGRNSAGGAISVVTNEPGNTWQEQALVRVGNYGTNYLDALLNAPINQDMAFRLSFVDNRSDGWLRDSATGQQYDKNNDWGFRAQFRWNAPGDTTVRVAWEHEKLNQPARPAIGIVPLPPAPGTPTFPPDPATYLDPFKAPVLNDVVDGRETRKFDGVTLRVEHPFAFGDLTSITAYRHFTTLNREDNDGTNRRNLYFDDANIEQNTSWSQEFKLSGKNALVDWVAGASYYYDNAHQESQLNLLTDSIDTVIKNLSPTPVSPDGTLYSYLTSQGAPGLLGDPWRESMFNHNISKAYAAYGDVIWHLTDKLNLTTGIRFTRDDREFSWYNPVRTATELDAALAELLALGYITPDQAQVLKSPLAQPGTNGNIEFGTPASTAKPLVVSNSWSDTSPRVVLDYKLTPDVMLYGSVTKGYEAGGYNFALPGSHYEPETVRNYEAGIKSYFPDYHLLLNASIYYYKYSNLQSLSLVSNGNGNLPLYLVTVSDQEAKGLEAEAHWQATDSLRLNFAGAYIDASYKHYVASDGKDLSGQPTGEPLFSATAGMDYLWHDVFNGDLDFVLQHAYRGKTRCNTDSRVQGGCLVTPAFAVGEAQNRTDLRLGWSSSGVPWSVAVFVNNVFDKRYVTGVNNITATVLGTPFANITPPRMWGVELGVKF